MRWDSHHGKEKLESHVKVVSQNSAELSPIAVDAVKVVDPASENNVNLTSRSGPGGRATSGAAASCPQAASWSSGRRRGGSTGRPTWVHR
jgi:hypothetical protein